MKHCLKTVQPFFGEVQSGNKTFEVRKNDRNFAPGDTLYLQEYDAQTKTYSGKEIEMRVTYVLKDFPAALRKGYVVLGIKDPHGE